MIYTICNFLIGFAIGYSGMTAILKKDFDHAVVALVLVAAVIARVLE